MLGEMDLSLDVASAFCPHCRSVNLFPGFSHMLPFTCKTCGKGVDLKGTIDPFTIAKQNTPPEKEGRCK